MREVTTKCSIIYIKIYVSYCMYIIYVTKFVLRKGLEQYFS